MCDLSSTPGSSSSEARATFVPRNSKLVSATAKLTKDFKASVSTYLCFRTRGDGVAADQQIPENVYEAFHQKFLTEGRSSEVDCGLLLKKLIYQQEQLMRFEAGLKAALVDSVSAVQHQIRIEDPAAYGRNGKFRQYRDDLGAAPIAHEMPCPTLTPQGRSVFVRSESVEPYGLSTHGAPEECLIFVVKNGSCICHDGICFNAMERQGHAFVCKVSVLRRSGRERAHMVRETALNQVRDFKQIAQKMGFGILLRGYNPLIRAFDPNFLRLEKFLETRKSWLLRFKVGLSSEGTFEKFPIRKDLVHHPID